MRENEVSKKNPRGKSPPKKKKNKQEREKKRIKIGKRIEENDTRTRRERNYRHRLEQVFVRFLALNERNSVSHIVLVTMFSSCCHGRVAYGNMWHRDGSNQTAREQRFIVRSMADLREIVFLPRETDLPPTATQRFAAGFVGGKIGSSKQFWPNRWRASTGSCVMRHGY